MCQIASLQPVIRWCIVAMQYLLDFQLSGPFANSDIVIDTFSISIYAASDVFTVSVNVITRSQPRFSVPHLVHGGSRPTGYPRPHTCVQSTIIKVDSGYSI